MAELAIVLTVGGAFLSASLQALFDKLASSPLQEFGSLFGVSDNLKRLSNTVVRIQSIMAEVDERQLLKDPSLSMWLKELKDVAYDAEDALDMFATELLWKREEGSFISSINLQGRDKKIGKMIDKILGKMKGIAQEWGELRLDRTSDSSCNGFHMVEMCKREWETSSLSGDIEVSGREREKEEIIRLLLGCDSKHSVVDSKLSVLPIIGMGGLGKTTLAQLIFHDARIDEIYEMKMWVWVSEDFDIRRVTRGILESCGEICPDIGNLEFLQRKVADKLRGKRFLLVLDDIWNEDHSQWSRLRCPLICGDKGSVVLITTRSENVAKAMKSMNPIYLEPLSTADCWNIFEYHTFASRNLVLPPKLEVIGKEIFKKAAGVPLAVKNLSDLLFCKTEEWRWRGILEADIWAHPQGEHDILLALRRSYHHLPAHLKRCFAYCALFPKKYVFDKQTVAQMWVAQGFIRTTLGWSMEEIGGDYFDDLVRKSLLAPSVTGYVMHDLLHDLAKIVSIDECLCIEKGHSPDLYANNQSIRHISFNSHIKFETLYGLKKARTLLNFFWHYRQGDSNYLSSWPSMRNDLDELLDKLKLLRTLDLSYSEILQVPDSVGSLKHLRYLDLSNTYLRKLPSSSCKLYNLQTLRLKDCIFLEDLPRGICNLLNLRHLVADAGLVSNIIGLGKLTSLQELEVFSVSRDKGREIEELKYMNELHGRLCIRNLQNIRNKKEVRPGILNNKLHLHKLKLEWNYNSIVTDRRNPRADEEILQNLEPPPNLKDITIKFYGGVEFPHWMNTRSIEFLETVSIYNCQKVKKLPCLGELPFLKRVLIKGMNIIECIGVEFTGTKGVSFPQLEKLEFCDLPEWSNGRWPQKVVISLA